MEQLTLGNLLNWIEHCPCKICNNKATWFDCTSGYCNLCFPYYAEMRLDKKKFIKTKEIKPKRKIEKKR